MDIAARRKAVTPPFALLALLAAALCGGCMKEGPPPEESATKPGASSGAPADHPPQLECLLGPPRSATLGQPVEISYVLRNTGSKPVWVLRWQTPLEDLRGDVLRIAGPDGKTVAYQGPMVKRGDPTPDEYVRLEPGAASERVFDAAAAYPIVAPGVYSVSFLGGLMDVVTHETEVPRRRDLLRPFPLTCGPFDFQVVDKK